MSDHLPRYAIEANYISGESGASLQPATVDIKQELLLAVAASVRGDGFSNISLIDMTNLPRPAIENWTLREAEQRKHQAVMAEGRRLFERIAGNLPGGGR